MGVRDNVRLALEELMNTRYDGNQALFGDSVGCPRQKVNNWMKGVCAPDLEKLGEIARVNEVSMDWMLGGDYSKAPADIVTYHAISIGDDDEA